MADYTQTQTIQVNSGGRNLTAENNYSKEGHEGRSISVPESSTDLEVAIELDVTQMEAFWLISDVDMVLKTNNASTPDDTITLKAGKPVIWAKDGYFANPFTVDVAAFFLTTGAVGEGTLDFECIIDPTV
jgi:hypothetical protein